MKIVNFRFLPIVAIFFVLGALSVYLYYSFGVIVFIVFLAFIVMAAVLLYAFFAKNNKALFLITFISSAIVFSFSLISMFVKTENYTKSYISEQGAYVTGTLSEINNYDEVILYFNNCEIIFGDEVIQNTKVAVTAFNYDFSLECGDTVSFFSNVSTNNSILENGYYNLSPLIGKMNYIADAEFSSGSYTYLYTERNLFLKLRYTFTKELKQNMNADSAAVATALLFGDSSEIDSETTTSFRNLGIAHLFAVSGLHIGFFAAALALLFRKIPIKPIFKAVFTALILFLYCGICGFTVSSLRAMIMCSVALFYLCFGKKYDSLNCIALSMIIVLFIDVAQLFSTGFLLSYATVIAISLMYFPLKRLFRFLPKTISSTVSVCLSAWLGSFPLCFNFFGYSSCIGILANLIIIPVISVFFIILWFALLLSLIPYLGFFLYLPSQFLRLLIKGINLFPTEYFIISDFRFGFAVVFYYFSLLSVSGKINISGKTKLIVFCSAFSLTLLSILAVNLL